MTSLGVAGEDIATSLDGCITNKTPLGVEVKVEEYDGKKQHKVKSFYKASTVSSSSGDDEFGE